MNTRCALWLRVAITFRPVECVRVWSLYRAWVTLILLTGTYAMAAPPLRVRLLGKEHPTRVEVAGTELRCDGEALKLARARVSLDGQGDLRVSDARSVSAEDGGLPGGVPDVHCRVLQLPRGGSVRLGEIARTCSGEVELRSGGAELSIDTLADLNVYTAAVITAEADSLPNEALKAQAVVSRSWALANRGRHADAGYDLCDLTHCQLYRGDEHIDANATAAVRTTSEVLLHSADGGFTDAAFHASCGGATSSSADIFGSEGVRGVSDLDAQGQPFCGDTGWTWDVKASELARALGGSSDAETRILKSDPAGRALSIRVLGTRMTGRDFLSKVQRAFDYQSLRSLKFSVTRVKDTLRFGGRGVGHGVGFCQAGAAGMAKQGARYDEILRHYFPESVVRGVRK